MGTVQPVVAAKGLTRRYGEKVAVDDVDLEVAPGTIFGFIGSSGSGKTTTVRLLTGIEGPTSGEVRVFGIPPTSFTARDRARIGYMPQLASLYPHLSVHENLTFVTSLYGLPLRRQRRLCAGRWPPDRPGHPRRAAANRLRRRPGRCRGRRSAGRPAGGPHPVVAWDAGGAQLIRTDGRGLRLVVADADGATAWLGDWFDEHDVPLVSLRHHVPTFDDVFVKLIEETEIQEPEDVG